jgi:Holliday junction DNA helicase RuvA
MIATLTGKVADVGGESCIIDVNGVGYLVLMPLPALESLSRTTEVVKIYTYFHLREDAANLFGFLNPEDKAIFEKLIGVSGVGPKTALAILSNLSGESIREAIEHEDHRALTTVSGVGLKTAQRLVLELKGKLGRITQSKAGEEQIPASNYVSVIGDAVDALVALGYPQKEAAAAVDVVYKADHNLTTPEMVRLALRNLGRK